MSKFRISNFPVLMRAGAMILMDGAHDLAASDNSPLGKWGPVNGSADATESCTKEYIVITANSVTTVGQGNTYSTSIEIQGNTILQTANGKITSLNFSFDGPNVLMLGGGPSYASTRYKRCS
jgi:hypothetical protein